MIQNGEQQYKDLHSALPNLPVWVYNFGSSVSELFELNAPYMLAYHNYQVKEGLLTVSLASPGVHASHVIPDNELPSQLWNRALHQHGFFEVMFVLEGNVKQHVERECYEYSAGLCCIMNRNIRHREEFSSDYQVVFLLLNDDFMKSLMENDIQYGEKGNSHNHLSAIYHLMQQNQREQFYTAKEYIEFMPAVQGCKLDETIAVIRTLLNHMNDEVTKQLPGCDYIVRGLLSRFFSIMEDTTLYQKIIPS
ncbi:MAG: AraC family ligand binding domain-containing protein [Clostridiales bacterium]|jgi:mannose-6-phosphate isomerase-like protein (cupin superfamily)|nr:AraC family ligand binding domain-containing protein [Clostridiales bacterium]